MFELRAAGISAEYVDRLCPGDLFHEYGLLMDRQRRVLREQVAVASAAGRIQSDGGEAINKMFDALKDPVERPVREAKPRVLKGAEEAQVAGTFSEAMAAFEARKGAKGG